MTWKGTVTIKKKEKKMFELTRITFFNGWTKQQVIDFILALILTIVSLTGTMMLTHIFG